MIKTFQQILLVTLFGLSLTLPLEAKDSNDSVSTVKIGIKNPIDLEEAAELENFIQFAINKKANERLIKRVTSALESLNKFNTIRCRFFLKQSGTRLQCELNRIPIVRNIYIYNLPLALLEKDLRKRLSVRRGESFLPNSVNGKKKIERQVKSVKSFLERQGFFNAKIHIDATHSPTAPTVDLHIRIKGGNFRRVHQVSLSSNVDFARSKIKNMFQQMCFNVKDLPIIFGVGGVNCYSREREKVTVQQLHELLNAEGYPTAIVSLKKRIVNPLSPAAHVKCRPTVKQIQKKEKTAPGRCINIHINIDLGPKLLAEFKFKDSQTISLDGAGMFFRNLFGVEMFSRYLDFTISGTKWNADQTILKNELKKALTFGFSRKIDEHEINLSVEKIKTYLAKRGYNFAKVTASYDNFLDQIIRVTFNIDPKSPYAINQIRFTGNPIFSEETISSSVTLPVHKRSMLTSGHFSLEDLKTSTLILQNFYDQNGYPKAQINVQQLLKESNNIELEFNIDPGTQYLVNRITIENGIDSINLEALRLLTNCKKAVSQRKATVNRTSYCFKNPFSKSSVLDDAVKIEDVYRNNGYLNTKVKSSFSMNKNFADITYTLTPRKKNPRIHTAGLLLDGNVLSKQPVIVRQMGKSLFQDTPPLNISDLESGIASLRQTNLFSRVRFKLIPDPQDEKKSFILLSVTEKPSLYVDVSLGFSTDTLLALGFEFNDYNLFGTMLQLTTQVDLGLFWGFESDFQNTLRWPSIFGLPLNLKILVPSIKYTNFINAPAKERHLLTELAANLDWQLTSVLFPFLKYELRWDKWQQADQIINEDTFYSLDGLISVFNQPSSLRNSITPGINFLKLDNPIDPKNGLQLSFSTDLSFALVGNNPPFQVLNGQLVHYYTLGPITFASQILIHRAFIDSPAENWWVLKYQSDFSALGGDKSVRGYNTDSIGIHGEILDSRQGKPILGKDGKIVEGFHPGNLTIQGNFEIRFPIKKNFFIGDLAGTIFTDMAFIDSCTGFFDCSDFSSPNGARKLNNQLGWSVGLGLRYLLPIGPISLDWAISPIRSANTSFGRMNRIHLSFGYMF